MNKITATLLMGSILINLSSYAMMTPQAGPSLLEESKEDAESTIINNDTTPVSSAEMSHALFNFMNNFGLTSDGLGQRPRSNSQQDLIKFLKPAITNFKQSYDSFQRTHDLFRSSQYEQASLAYIRLLNSDEGTPTDRRIAAIGYGESQLALNNFVEGFKWRERRITKEHNYATDKLWDGKVDLNGKTLLIYANECGFGDIVFFQCRYYEIIQKYFPKCTIILEGNIPQQSIYSLLNNTNSTSVISAKPGTYQAYDYALHGMSLPHFFSTEGLTPTTLDSLPNKPGYLKANPDLVAQWESYLTENCIQNGLLPIGIFWAASPQPGGVTRRYERDIDPTLLINTLNACGKVKLFNLQGPGSEAVAAQHHENLKTFEGFDKAAGPFQDTAAFMEALKNVGGYIVGIDTGGLNFAGAIGVKTIGLLPAFNDWRWGTIEPQSLWFPSITLVRQAIQGDWTAALAIVQDIITKEIAELPYSNV